MLSRGGFNETIRIHGMKIQTYLVPDVSDNNDGLLYSFCFRTFDRRNFGPIVRNFWFCDRFLIWL
jgi:hypothetical protein